MVQDLVTVPALVTAAALITVVALVMVVARLLLQPAAPAPTIPPLTAPGLLSTPHAEFLLKLASRASAPRQAS